MPISKRLQYSHLALYRKPTLVLNVQVRQPFEDRIYSGALGAVQFTIPYCGFKDLVLGDS
jgi:hypothetical protein